MISVIVPAYNASKTIGKCLKALLEQNLSKKDYEIIVVDDGSGDTTREVVSGFDVRLFARHHQGPASARNFGASKARGDILLFTDADCVPSRNWIARMSEPFRDTETVGVSGTYRTLNKESAIARFAGYEIEKRHERLSKLKKIDFIGTFSAGYRKSTFRRFGGFDRKYGMASGEDPDLSFRISSSGGKMVFQPKAYVFHTHPDTILKFLRQKFWRGYWRVRVYRRNRKKIFGHSYTPRSLFIEEALSGFTTLSWILTGAGIVPVVASVSLLGMLILMTLPLSYSVYKKDRAVGLMSPFIIILRDISTGLGIVWGIMFNR